MRRIAAVAVGLVLAILLVGLALMPLVTPPFTRVLTQRFSLAQEAGLPRDRMFEVAEKVRTFVVDPRVSTLPTVVDGRPGFDASAVSHLNDVRSVVAGAQFVTWSLAILLSLWLGLAVARGRLRYVAGVMRAGAIWCCVLVALAVVAGLSDFDALFSAFHGLFFAAGTWTFASDSLLIQTFPEPFWATSAGVWAGLVLLGAAALAVGARGLTASQAGARLENEEGPSADGT